MTLLEKLLDCFEKAKSDPFPAIAKTKYISFLLGSNLGATYQNSDLPDGKKNGTGWSAAEIELFINTPESDWDVRYPENISDKYPFRKFCTAKVIPADFIQHVESLITEHFPEEESSFTNCLFKKLCAYAFFGTPDPKTLFEPFKHGTLRNYVSWETKETDIKRKLSENNLIFISGKPASGKTLITKKVLKDLFCTSSDNYFINIEDSNFSDGLSMINFVDGTHDFEVTLSYLKKKTNRSCLVIKKPFLSKDDFEFINENLSSLAMKVIVLTQMTLDNIPYPHISLDDRPNENLKTIYEASRGEDDLTTNEWNTLLEIVSRNPYVLSLIGKALKNPKNLKKDANLKEKFLNKNLWIGTWNTTAQPTAHGTYRVKNTKSEQALPSLISHILDCYGNTEIYSKLSVWARIPVTKQFLTTYTDISCEVIDNALNHGILEFDSENDEIVFMPALMADTIWQKHSNSDSYRKYHDQLMDFFYLLHVGNRIQLPYKTLYNVIRILLRRFHFQISVLEYRKNPRKNSDLMEWNELLIRIIHRLTDLGDCKTAEEFLQYIFFFVQEKKVKDAANADEALIRKMIQLKVHHMQNSITCNNVDYSIQLLNTAKEMYFKSKHFKNSLGLRFVLLEYENLLNYLIRLGNSFLIEDFCNASFNATLRVQTLLDQLHKYLQLKIKFDDIDSSYYYFAFAYESIKNIYTASVSDQYNLQAEAHINDMLSLKNADGELVVKTYCQSLYYKLIVNLKDLPEYTWHITDFQSLQSEYCDLADYLQQKILPWEIIVIFSYSSYIMYCFKNLLNEPTLSHVNKSIQQLNEFATDQLTLPKEDLQQILQGLQTFSS